MSIEYSWRLHHSSQTKNWWYTKKYFMAMGMQQYHLWSKWSVWMVAGRREGSGKWRNQGSWQVNLPQRVIHFAITKFTPPRLTGIFLTPFQTITKFVLKIVETFIFHVKEGPGPPPGKNATAVPCLLCVERLGPQLVWQFPRIPNVGLHQWGYQKWMVYKCL